MLNFLIFDNMLVNILLGVRTYFIPYSSTWMYIFPFLYVSMRLVQLGMRLALLLRLQDPVRLEPLITLLVVMICLIKFLVSRVLIMRAIELVEYRIYEILLPNVLSN